MDFLKYNVDVLKARCDSLLKQKHGVGRLFPYCVTDMERIFTNQWNKHLRMKRNVSFTGPVYIVQQTLFKSVIKAK
jgi:hypothetical protein